MESSGIGNRTIYSVYANFSSTNLRVVNVFNFGRAVTAGPLQGNQIAQGRVGSMNAVHNDLFIGDIDLDEDGTIDVFNNPGTWAAGAGTWTTAATDSLTDSYCTLQGIGGAWGTAFDPSMSFPPFGTDIATNAGWYDATPSVPNIPSAAGRLKVLQVARLSSDLSDFRANLTIGYAVTGTSTALFGYGSFAIPAPGALALLGFAGIVGTRRRS
ncbi:MAG: hypothetical protein FJ285_08360 [Planctomycetes bacterium]|nr:hypothetical protein [Planctomycetota bacterium]